MYITGLNSQVWWATYIFIELAKDALHKTGLYSVVEGIISPVNDDYQKLTTKVCFINKN